MQENQPFRFFIRIFSNMNVARKVMALLLLRIFNTSQSFCGRFKKGYACRSNTEFGFMTSGGSVNVLSTW